MTLKQMYEERDKNCWLCTENIGCDACDLRMVKKWLEGIRKNYEQTEDAPELVTEDLRLIDEIKGDVE